MNTAFTLRRNNVVITATIALAAIMAGCIDGQAQQPSPELANQARALAMTCRGDFTRFCAGVQPGGGRGLACLQQHLSELTAECRSAIPRAEALRSKAAETGAPPR